MAAGRPVSPELRARAIELITTGMARNAVARELKLAPSAITRLAQAEGLTFDRSHSAAAVAARQSDLKARRLQLVEELMSKAEDHLVAIDQPFLAFNFGGKDNTYEERELDRPPTGDLLNLHRAASLALKDARDLIRDDDDEGVGEAESLLMNLVLELGLADD